MVRPSARVLKRLPPRLLQRLNNRERFVFEGISYSPVTSEDENENEQKIVGESDEHEMEIDQSLTAEAKADSTIPTSSNAEAPAEQRNTIYQSQQSRLALLYPRYLQPTTSAPTSQTTKLLPSIVNKTNPKPQQNETPEQPDETIPLTTEKVLIESFNAPKLPEIDASHLNKESQRVNPVDTPNVQERRNSGKKRAHPLTPQRQQFEFTDNSNDGSPVASRVPPKRVPQNPAPSENILEDVVLQTPSPPKETCFIQENISKSPIDHDFGNDSFGENESSRRSIRIYDASPITTVHAFDDLSGNNEEIPTIPARTIYTNVVASASVNNDSENVEAGPHNSSHSIPAQNVPIPSVATISTSIKKKNVVQYFEQKPEIIKPNCPPSDEPFVRRTTRTRVRKLRLELGEKAIYKYDENGMASLVDIKMNEQNYAHAGASQNGGGKRNGRKTTTKK
uniref:Uncharacterized protein n=1 Tax=Panagrolaimus sp. PS1159 TaxID=55785 RepID=A0AC35FHF1_9BILA